MSFQSSSMDVATHDSLPLYFGHTFAFSRKVSPHIQVVEDLHACPSLWKWWMYQFFPSSQLTAMPVPSSPEWGKFRDDFHPFLTSQIIDNYLLSYQPMLPICLLLFNHFGVAFLLKRPWNDLETKETSNFGIFFRWKAMILRLGMAEEQHHQYGCMTHQRATFQCTLPDYGPNYIRRRCLPQQKRTWRRMREANEEKWRQPRIFKSV